MTALRAVQTARRGIKRGSDGRGGENAGGRHARSPLSGRPESLFLFDSALPRYKDSGFRIGEEYSRYASLFLYRTK